MLVRNPTKILLRLLLAKSDGKRTPPAIQMDGPVPSPLLLCHFKIKDDHV